MKKEMPNGDGREQNMKFRARRSVDDMTAREKINLGVGKKREENTYYKKVSRVYRALKVATLFILMIYLGVTFAMYHTEITYENLVYLIKDLDTDGASSGVELYSVEFDLAGRYAANFYRDRLAVCFADSFKLYGSEGKVEYEYTHSMESPAISVGDKYVLAYDIGGSTYSVYTTIARVLSKQSDEEISCAAMGASGEYAIVTRARENKYVVNFYDRNFRETSKIYKDKYVMTTAISDDGKNYCIASFDVENGSFTCEVMYGGLRSDKAETVSVENALPLKSGFFSDGSFTVICDSCVLFFDSNGELSLKRSLENTALSIADIAYDKVLTVAKESVASDVNFVSLLDKNGEVLSQRTESGKISCAALGKTSVFEAVSGTLHRYDFNGTFDSEKCALGVEKLIPEGNAVLICTSDGAIPAFAAEGFFESGGNESESSDTPKESGETGGFDIDLESNG